MSFATCPKFYLWTTYLFKSLLNYCWIISVSRKGKADLAGLCCYKSRSGLPKLLWRIAVDPYEKPKWKHQHAIPTPSDTLPRHPGRNCPASFSLPHTLAWRARFFCNGAVRRGRRRGMTTVFMQKATSSLSSPGLELIV